MHHSIVETVMPDGMLKTMQIEHQHWYVYILRCKDGTLYAGITKDIARRCLQHNAGTASKYTRSRRPVKLVYQEQCPDQSTALKRELAIKAMTRRAKLQLI